MISMSRWSLAHVRRRHFLPKLRRLYFGAADEKGGAVSRRALLRPHHLPPRAGCLSGMGESEASLILKDFFPRAAGAV